MDMSSPMRWGPPPPPRGGGGGGGYYNILGHFVRKPVVWLGAAILVMSAGGAVLEGMGVPVSSSAALTVARVWRGEIWRLVTWSLLATDPFALAFSLLALFFFGQDLMSRWGTSGFFMRYFGAAVVVGVLTCVIVKFLAPVVSPLPHQGVYPLVLEAMVIAWAVLFPDRTILLFFVLPIKARYLIHVAIFLTLLYGVFGSFLLLIPYCVAIGVALIYMDVFSFRRLYLRGRVAMLERDYKRRTAHLHVVDRDRDEPPRWTH